MPRGPPDSESTRQTRQTRQIKDLHAKSHALQDQGKLNQAEQLLRRWPGPTAPVHLHGASANGCNHGASTRSLLASVRGRTLAGMEVVLSPKSVPRSQQRMCDVTKNSVLLGRRRCSPEAPSTHPGSEQLGLLLVPKRTAVTEQQRPCWFKDVDGIPPLRSCRAGQVGGGHSDKISTSRESAFNGNDPACCLRRAESCLVALYAGRAASPECFRRLQAQAGPEPKRDLCC